MKSLLVINTSPRTTRSYTRKLTGTFTDIWLKKYPGAFIVWRDLGLEHVPHVSENWIAGAFKPKELRSAEEHEALAKSDEYINELKKADIIVMGVPMYNYSFPSSLKAYLDQVLRVHETWELDRENIRDPYIGQLKNKKLYLLMSRGAQGYEKGGYNEHVNFQTTYLRATFKMMGIVDIHEISINGELLGGSSLAESIENSQLEIKRIVEDLNMVFENK
ncbi:MAG: NAD(P)H-dependent oxidoreductase [Mucilaginibacter sp.]|uniref:FMN-dependent NADH-azoreductase n=1 Tax=Mucilaginibacter sp. TaxID=1882438 RepID=UPI0031A127E5